MLKALARLLASKCGVHLTRCPAPLAARPARMLNVTLAMAAAHLLDRPGATFFQAGGFDGCTNDALFPLVRRYGLRGVCLEPQPFAFARLRDTYRESSQVTLLNAAVDWNIGTRPLYVVDGAETTTDRDWLQLASFDRSLVERNLFGSQAPITTIDVECVTVLEAMRRAQLERVEILQVDVEGYDHQVIRMFAASEVWPNVIRYENAHLNRADRRDCIELLLARGYQIAYDHQDVIACLPT